MKGLARGLERPSVPAGALTEYTASATLVAMVHEHLKALLDAGEAKAAPQGARELPDGRTLTLYVSSNGAHLTVNRVTSLREDGELIYARTVKGEIFVLSRSDVYAGAVEAPASGGRKAGFV